MLLLAADENIGSRLIRALFRRIPTLDLVRVQDTELYSAADPQVLAWAAQEQRVLLTHDFHTIPPFAYERIAASKPMPGVILVPSTASISLVLDDLVLLIEGSRAGEWEGQIIYLPL